MVAPGTKLTELKLLWGLLWLGPSLLPQFLRHLLKHVRHKVRPVPILGVGHGVNLADQTCWDADGNLRHAWCAR